MEAFSLTQVLVSILIDSLVTRRNAICCQGIQAGEDRLLPDVLFSHLCIHIGSAVLLQKKKKKNAWADN